MAKKIRAYNGSFLSLTGADIDTINIPASVKHQPLHVNGTAFGKSINVHRL